MSANTPNNQDQEIDLSLLTKKIGNFFESINTSIFKGILFVKKNIIIFGVLFVLGAALGYLLDKNTNTYKSEVIVTPNFGSVDYLYSKINLLESKILTRDTVFLKSIGINNSKEISLIAIEPVIDIYNFVTTDSKTSVNNAQNSQNFELVKLLSEDGDIKKVIKDEMTSKNYNHHKIKLTTKSRNYTSAIINSILVYLEQTVFFEKTRLSYVNNFNLKMKQNNQIVLQIDGLLNQFSTSSNGTKNDKLVYYNENTQLNDIIQTKNGMLTENSLISNQLINLDKVIKERSRVANIKDIEGSNNKMKFILPFVFITLFVLYGFFIDFYRKQSAKISNL